MTRVELNKLISEDFARPIDGYHEYFVTRDGRVISTIKHNGVDIRELRYSFVKGGYRTCFLYKESRRQQFLIHRLVGMAFIQNPDNLPFINHKDENKENNNVDNLEWCSREYNNNYGTRTQRASESNIDGSKCKEVAQIAEDGTIVKIWLSARNASRNAEFSYKNISACCKGDKKSHLGYYWKFTRDLSEQELSNKKVIVTNKSKRIHYYKLRQQTPIFQVVI